MENLVNNTETLAAELGLESTVVTSSEVTETPVLETAEVAVATSPEAVAIEESVEALVPVEEELVEEAPVQETEAVAIEELVAEAAEAAAEAEAVNTVPVLSTKVTTVEAAEYISSEDTIASINAAIRGTIGEEGGAFAKAFDFKHYNNVYKFLKKDADFSLATLVEIAKKAGFKLDIVATKIDEEIEGLDTANQLLIDSIADAINASLLEKFTSTKAGEKAVKRAEEKAVKDAQKAADKATKDAQKAADKAAKIAQKEADKAAAKAAKVAEEVAAVPSAELPIDISGEAVVAENVAEEVVSVEPSILKATVDNSEFEEDTVAVEPEAPVVTTL